MQAVAQVYQEHLQHCDLRSCNPAGNPLTFYKPTNSGPQAALGTSVDTHCPHRALLICTTECLLKAIALVECFIKKIQQQKTVLKLLATTKDPLSFLMMD